MGEKPPTEPRPGAALPALIDVHLHVGRLYLDEPKGLSPECLLGFMDANGIERAVLLPVESPECTSFYVPTTHVLNVCGRWPERFVPFCNVDPRRRGVEELLRDYHERGCLGYGEAMSGLPIVGYLRAAAAAVVGTVYQRRAGGRTRELQLMCMRRIGQGRKKNESIQNDLHDVFLCGILRHGSEKR